MGHNAKMKKFAPMRTPLPFDLDDVKDHIRKAGYSVFKSWSFVVVAVGFAILTGLIWLW